MLDKSSIKDTFSSKYDNNIMNLTRSKDIYHDNEFYDRGKLTRTEMENHYIGYRDYHDDYKK